MMNVEKIKPTGLFTNYIYKAIPLAFDESMSYYETLCGLLSYLKDTVIPALNNNADAIIEVQELMSQLQNYVDTYFDNLDIQEEINNKLDEMAESGVLEEIMADYLDTRAIFGFDNVADMKLATNLTNGSFARTLGYSNKNDGNGALYKIRPITNEDDINEINIIALADVSLIAELIGNKNVICFNTVADMKNNKILTNGCYAKTLGYYNINDDGNALYYITNETPTSYYETLNNGLYAKLIHNGEINVKQFGAYGDETHDDTTAIQNAINYTITGGVIVFPVGKYLVNNLNITKSLTLKGLSISGLDGETSLCLKDENNKILTINSQPNIISGFKIENLCFSGRLLTTNVLCDIKYLSNLLITNCVFKHVNGSAIKLQRVMESTIFNSVILRCGNETNSAIELLDYVNQVSENCNNIHIDNCTFGQNGGNWIKCTNNSNVDVLWITNNKFEYDGLSIVANANNTAVIYLGKNARTNILNNTFTQFTDVRNKYVKIIEYYSGQGPLSILNNKINGCKGTFIISNNDNGVIISDNNIMMDCDDTMTDVNVITSAYTNINPTILLNSNGSLPTRYSNYKYTFTPFYSLCAAVKHNIQYDADSVNYLKNCVLTSPYTEIARIRNIYKNLNTDFKIKFRAKKLEDSTPSPHLFLYKKGSSDTMIGDVAITSTDFDWYEFSVANADILNATSFFMTSNDTPIQALLDVIIINA